MAESREFILFLYNFQLVSIEHPSRSVNYGARLFWLGKYN